MTQLLVASSVFLWVMLFIGYRLDLLNVLLYLLIVGTNLKKYSTFMSDK